MKSDIVFPGRYSYIETGEHAQDNPLSWDQISPADYQTWNVSGNFDFAVEQSKKRIASNSYMMLIDEQAQWIKSQQDDDIYSLNYEDYSKELKLRIEETAKYDRLDDFKSSFTLQAPKLDIPELEKDADLKGKRLRWEEGLEKDIYLFEAVNVLEDLILPADKINKLAQIKE